MERESSRSIRRLRPLDLIVVAATVIVGSGVFLVSSSLTYRLGFPLDDSWIHATYARNLAEQGQWAFRPGLFSAGSTSPIWTLLLVPGFWMHLGPLWWSYALGALTLFSLGLLMESTVRTLVAAYDPALPWVGVFIAGEWHMLWAAMSGMETLLHALAVTLVLGMLVTGSRRYLSLGLLSGLSVWIRPDGLTLAGPVIVTIFFLEGSARARSRALISYVLGLGSLLVPYVLVNLLLSGTPMPNTFYAKQAEYAAWQARPLMARIGVLAIQLLNGPAILLVPGVFTWMAESVRRRSGAMLAVMLWTASYLLLYVIRLPVYQHARYLMPAMPVLFFFGILGSLRIPVFNRLSRFQSAGQFAVQATLALLTIGFALIGGRAYGQDVGLIESEMVTVAKWVAHNVPAGQVVAAHDIGALGYFDDHPLIDLAGLVSPGVVPFIRDEARLARYLDSRGARYLIAFPDVYPSLVKTARPVFSSGGKFAPEMGEQNMTVYCWACR